MINNIYVHKIGINNYEGIKDKNSGSYEYEKIINEITDVAMKFEYVYSVERLVNSPNIYGKGSALIIIGGKPNGIIDETLKYIINDFDISIFIATDIDCLEMSKEMIYECDYLLHQSPICLGYKDKKHELYSWIPEIFYNPEQELIVPKEFKNKCILFAGSLDGRKEKIENIIKIDDSCVVIPKDSGHYSYDFRLEYSEYKKLLPLFQNTYVTVCQEALNVGWVTSRFVESVSCDVIPIVDKEYDRFKHFEGILDEVEGSDYKVVDMDVSKDYLKYNRNNFKKLLKEILTYDL